MNSMPRSQIAVRWFAAAVAASATMIAAVAIATATMGHAAGEISAGASSGLPIPRYVSLKPDKVNVRGGPTRNHDISWQYTRAGLPVEITAESDNWRRIRDWEGAEGWVYHSMLSGRRTGTVNAKEKDALVPLHAKPHPTAPLTAQLQSGVL